MKTGRSLSFMLAVVLCFASISLAGAYRHLHPFFPTPDGGAPLPVPNAGNVNDYHRSFDFTLEENGPWGAIGMIDINDGEGHGSGVLIGDRYVLTAAHVVHGASELNFILTHSGDGGSSRFFSSKAEDWMMSSAWSSRTVEEIKAATTSTEFYELVKDDIAIIKLDNAIPLPEYRPEPITIAKLWDETDKREIKDKVLWMSGYGVSGPGTTGAGANDQRLRVGHNVVDRIWLDNRIIETDFDAPATYTPTIPATNPPTIGGKTASSGTNSLGDPWSLGDMWSPQEGAEFLPDGAQNPNGLNPNRHPVPELDDTGGTYSEYLVASGDSGGPDFIYIPDLANPGEGEWRIASINNYVRTAFGDADQTMNFTYGEVSGHLRVSKFLDWIDNTIGKLESGQQGDNPEHPMAVGWFDEQFPLHQPIGFPLTYNPNFGDNGFDTLPAAQNNIAEYTANLNGENIVFYVQNIDDIDNDGISDLAILGFEDKTDPFRSKPPLFDNAQVISKNRITNGYVTVFRSDDGLEVFVVTDEDGEMVWLDFKHSDDQVVGFINAEGEGGQLFRKATVVTLTDNPYNPIPLPMAPIILGDMNLDGVINGFDVDPFVATLLGGDYRKTADMNSDGVVNGFDVDLFNNVLLGANSGQQVDIPEPATLILLGLGSIAMLKRRHA